MRLPRYDVVFLGIAIPVLSLSLGYPLWWFLTLLHKGISSLTFEFLWSEPLLAGRGGGIYPMIVSTIWITALALLVALPIGMLSSIFLYWNDEAGRGTRLIRYSFAGLASVPSIVYGLFGAAFFAEFLGFGVSIFSGGLTLAVMILPFFVSGALASIHEAADEHAVAAQALGLSRTTTLLKILLRAAMGGIVSAFFVATGRALAETAALLFTAGYVLREPGSVFDPGRSLSVHIFDLALNVPGGSLAAYKSAAVLILMIILLSYTGGIFRWLMAKRGVHFA